MTKYILVVAFIVAWSPVFAQHPCDVQNPTTYREPGSKLSSLKISFCFDPHDIDGDPIDGPIGFAIQINGGPDIDLGVLQPISAPNAKGYQLYETKPPSLAAGTIVVKAYTAEGWSPPSSAVTLSLSGPPKYPTAVVLKPSQS